MELIKTKLKRLWLTLSKFAFIQKEYTYVTDLAPVRVEHVDTALHNNLNIYIRRYVQCHNHVRR